MSDSNRSRRRVSFSMSHSIRNIERKLPVNVKVGSTLAAFLLLSGLGQRSLFRWAMAPYMAKLQAAGVLDGESALLPRDVLWRMVVAMGGPLLICAIGTGAILGYLARRRMRPLVRAMRTVSKGQLNAPLPEPPDPDFREVRDAFEIMRVSLSEALFRLERADTQRRRLFSDLSHELATPTSAVLGLVDTLASPALCSSDEDRLRLLTSLEGEALRMSRLVSDLRDLAELDDPDVPFFEEPVQLGARIEETAKRFSDLEGAQLVVEVEECWISADSARVEQVLANLITNARRHTPAEGSIHVSVKARPERAVLVVEDSGPGVPDELVGRLGERLLRLDSSRDRRTGGSGLGLSIVRQIAERHSASLAFDRGGLGGLRATVEFPRITRSGGPP